MTQAVFLWTAMPLKLYFFITDFAVFVDTPTQAYHWADFDPETNRRLHNITLKNLVETFGAGPYGAGIFGVTGKYWGFNFEWDPLRIIRAYWEKRREPYYFEDDAALLGYNPISGKPRKPIDGNVWTGIPGPGQRWNGYTKSNGDEANNKLFLNPDVYSKIPRVKVKFIR